MKKSISRSVITLVIIIAVFAIPDITMFGAKIPGSGRGGVSPGIPEVPLYGKRSLTFYETSQYNQLERYLQTS
jgi:hypothetical protein